ncbi:protein FAR-RED IMPAIRED RESPONSE 1-like [Nicotiana tabacum]|uniref:Protein FAR-RED IMPAIRED RESPONSE 1-like n=1 Tax=Nicotiana tabacum TaxID=4097 RepID=A0AC58UQE6_TOBAC
MASLQHFNPGKVVEWKHDRRPYIPKIIFRYVFWAFKSFIDGFVHCRSIISIDNTHVYEKYDTKMLIFVGVDANGQIFFLAFAICANESQETWAWFLNHLKKHVVRHRSDICLISNQHDMILSSVCALEKWKKSYGYHRYCIRHLKSNFQWAYMKKGCMI